MHAGYMINSRHMQSTSVTFLMPRNECEAKETTYIPGGAGR